MHFLLGNQGLPVSTIVIVYLMLRLRTQIKINA